MKKNILGVILLVAISAATITGCTSNVGTASSWPGFNVNDEIAVVSYASKIYALDTQNGTKVWTYPAETNTSVAFYAPVEFADGMVLAGDYGHTLYAINENNGLLTWKFEGADNRYVASSLYAGGYIYAPNADGKLYVLDQNGALQWTFETAGPNWSKPVADEQYVYLTSMDHHIYALNLSYASADLTADKNGNRIMVEKPIWVTDLETAVVSDPLFSDGYLYVGTIAGKVFKVDASNGSVVWTFQDDTLVKSVWTKPTMVDDVLFFATEDGYIFALNIETGDPVWNAPLASGTQIVASAVEFNGSVGFGTTTGNLVIVDKDQVTAPSIIRDGSIYTTPYFVDGKLFLTYVGGDKLVYALDENGREFWSFSTQD